MGPVSLTSVVADTDGCPLDSRCTGCGRPDDLTVVLASPGPGDGTACVTLCPSCVGRELPDMVSDAAIAGLVAAHSTHTVAR